MRLHVGHLVRITLGADNSAIHLYAVLFIPLIYPIFRLQSPLTDYYLSKSFFPNLRSIDLSDNNLTDLESFIHYTRDMFYARSESRFVLY